MMDEEHPLDVGVDCGVAFGFMKRHLLETDRYDYIKTVSQCPLILEITCSLFLCISYSILKSVGEKPTSFAAYRVDLCFC